MTRGYNQHRTSRSNTRRRGGAQSKGICEELSQSAGGTHLEGGEHLSLLLAVSQVVMVLHRDEGSEVVCDRIVYETVSRFSQLLFLSGWEVRSGRNLLCIAWTAADENVPQ